MAVLLDTRTGPVLLADGAGDQPIRQDRTGAVVTTDAHGRYNEAASRRQVYMAHAIVTAPVIFSTAAGTGGPLLWNGSGVVNASILALGFGVTVVTTVAAALGITGNTGQTSAPTTVTAIDSHRNCYIGGPLASCSVYRIGTVANAGNFFMPLAYLHTGALTVDNFGLSWIDIGGAIVVPPNAWCSIAASATATTTVAQLGMIWEETPIPV
jgi:hypothetical protein